MSEFSYGEQQTIIIDRLQHELSELEQTVQRVRDLHKEDEGYCSGCFVAEDDPNQPGIAVPSVYPCDTIKALDGNE